MHLFFRKYGLLSTLYFIPKLHSVACCFNHLEAYIANRLDWMLHMWRKCLMFNCPLVLVIRCLWNNNIWPGLLPHYGIEILLLNEYKQSWCMKYLLQFTLLVTIICNWVSFFFMGVRVRHPSETIQKGKLKDMWF